MAQFGTDGHPQYWTRQWSPSVCTTCSFHFASGASTSNTDCPRERCENMGTRASSIPAVGAADLRGREPVCHQETKTGLVRRKDPTRHRDLSHSAIACATGSCTRSSGNCRALSCNVASLQVPLAAAKIRLTDATDYGAGSHGSMSVSHSSQRPRAFSESDDEQALAVLVHAQRAGRGGCSQGCASSSSSFKKPGGKP